MWVCSIQIVLPTTHINMYNKKCMHPFVNCMYCKFPWINDSWFLIPSNTATKIPTIFRDRVMTELIYRLILPPSFYLSLTVILTSHFSSITYYRQQQQQNKPMRYEILPTHPETHRNTTRKVANLYIEFNYHFLTLKKKYHYFWTGV